MLNTPRIDVFRVATHVGALSPLALLIRDIIFGHLSVNPIQDIIFRTGKPALVLLVLTLACTPANTIFGLRSALRIRRMLGLYAFSYASLHFLMFAGLDYGFNPFLLREAIIEKPYALVGFSAFLTLIPLAITSTDNWVRRLGKRWKKIHRIAYLAGILAVVHYIWLVKSDIRQPLAFGVAVILLMLARTRSIKIAATRLRIRLRSLAG